MSNWNASNYLERKARRVALVKPEWVTNPETGEEFYLRKVGGLMSSVLAGYMPAGLTKTAVEAWREKGVAGLEPGNLAELAQTLTPEQREAGERETRTLARIVQQACVIPYLSNDLPGEIEFPKEWKETAIQGLKEKDKDFDAEFFDPKDYVFDPQQLDEKDTIFLFQWAKGLATGVSLKGGNVTGIQDVERFRKKPHRGTRTRSDGPKILQSA